MTRPGREKATSSADPDVPGFELEEVVIAVYAALDDALAEAGVSARKGKPVPRRRMSPDEGAVP